MSRGQIFGTIINDSFLKDDHENVRRYDRRVVIRGKPEFNDTIVFEQDRSKTVTKIWLLKELDNEVEVKTEPTVSPVAAPRPFPSIYEDSPVDITVRKPEIPKRPIPKPRVPGNNGVGNLNLSSRIPDSLNHNNDPFMLINGHIVNDSRDNDLTTAARHNNSSQYVYNQQNSKAPSSYVTNGTFYGSQAVARQNVNQPLQSGAQGSSTDNQPTPRQKFELLLKGGASSQSKANDTGSSVMKGYSTEARQSPTNPFRAAAVPPQKRQQNPSVKVDVSEDSDEDDSGDDESEEKEENPSSSNHAGIDNDDNKNSANKDKKNTKKGKEKKKNNRNAEGNKNKNKNNPNKYQNNNGSTQNLRSKTNTAPAEKKKRVFHTGYVTNFIRKDDKQPYGFIRSKAFQKDTMNQEVVLAEVNEINDRDNDVFFPFDNVQSNLLDLIKGDDVEFHTFTNDKNSKSKLKAAVVKVVRLNRRSYQDLLSYVTMVKDLVAPQIALDNCTAGFESDDEFDYFGGFSSDDDEAHFRRITRREESGKQKPKHDPSSIMKLVADPTVWQMITEQISNLPNGDTLLCLLLEVVSFLHKARRTLEERFRQVLVSITSSSKFFNPIKGRLLGFIKTSCASNTNVKLMQDFLLLVAQLVPEKRPAIIAFIKPMMEKPGEDTAAFLYKMLKTLSSGSSESIADLDWRDLPLILKKEEIFEPNFTQMMNIRPVQVRGNYDCAEDYMDVYFRLLREDCFSQLKKCIRQLLDGKLDTRDMNVYKNVALVGISLKDNSLYLALRIVSLKEIRDWDTSSSLMFGNLLCISIGGSFQKPIWVTVASREMLKKDSIVIVQSCWEWNDVDDAEILLNLITSKGSVWMVESPTYYRAFQPVLQSLQQLDANSISFKDELVDLQPGPLPDFLHESSDFDAYLVHKVPKQGRITVKDFLNTPHSNNSVFDKSQEEAVKNALKNRIGIIQGPPGCGKSFIGVKMLQLLLSLSSLEDPKVLVLTYKNHALDEFLKGTMKIIGNENVVRIGGRCKDPELDNISLGTCKKNSKLKPEFRDQIMGLKDYIDEAKEQITSQFKSLNKLRNFKYEMLWSHLSQEQVRSLLIHCPWDDLKVFLNFGDDIDDQSFTKQKNKRNRQTKMTKQKVEEVLNSNKWEKYTESFLKLNKEALKCWMPSEKDFDDFESLLIGTKATTVKLKIPTKQELKEIKEKAKGKNGQVEDDEKGLYEIEDQQEIEDEQRERMSAITKTNFAVKSDFQKTLQMVDYKDEDQEDKGYTIKAFSSGALQKLEEMDAAVLMNLNDLWEMSKEERIKFTQMIVHRETKEVREEFQKQLHSYEEFSKQKAEIENQRTAGILKEKKVIGVTITGASINKQLLKEIQPEIVIVEEAAEVLEPQLLASIGTWTKYMLLIGDHQQLRPSVDSYELRKNYNFDLSMMERLINNNMSFKTLQMQNRQRVEFAELLFDIYPGLKTNHERVKNNEPATCLQKSSFFWHHAELESKDRSVTNPEEAKRAVKLALFLVQQGYKADKITILATYRGQTALIRKTLREYEKNYAHLIKEDVQISEMEIANAARGQKKEQTAKDSIKVHTVDMILSLYRW